MQFICTKCGHKEPVTTRHAHCDCGGLWDLDFTPPAFSLDKVDRSQWSLFRYRKFLTLDDESWRGVTLGEGMTPVVPLDDDMIRAHGAVCTVVPGSRDHCAEVCRAKVEHDGAYYANHVYNPFFYEGTKTYIYEVYEQLGRIPAHLVIPVGNGTLFLGAIYALEHLLRSGCIDRMPQIIALQSEHCDPLLRAAQSGADAPADVCPTPTIAEGIAIGKPMRGEEILALSKKYNIAFVHAPEDKILAARAELAHEGIYCEHTTAANYAAYQEYCRLHGETPDTLITMCGAGLKSDH